MWRNDYLNPIKLSKDRILLENEDLVYEYFRLISRKDVRHLLDLFTEDAVIDEPFSKSEDGGLKVNYFIMTVLRIYDMVQIEEVFISSLNQISVICTSRQRTIRFLFTFGYDGKDKSHSNRRIKFLRIQFIQKKIQAIESQVYF
jgi:hypothetical protein